MIAITVYKFDTLDGAEVDKVSDTIKKKDWKFEIISTNLSKEQEQQLREEIGAE